MLWRRPAMPQRHKPRVSGSTRGGGGRDQIAPATSNAPALTLDRVTFAYQRIPVLRDVSLEIRTHEFVAIVGANGSGKTTLMRVALGLLRPTQGVVRLFDTTIDRFTDWGRIGYVPQRAVAQTSLPVSVEEVVGTGLAGRIGLIRRPSRAQRDRIEHVLDLTGLAAVRKRRIGRLSGGQQQRALIARALVTAPSLLVLDEPTTGVDAEARSVLRESLEHLVQVEGVAVVYVSHDPEGFAELADRVLAVRAGQVFDVTATQTGEPSERGAR